MDLDLEDDIVKEFLVESYENLDRLDQDLLALEEAPDNRDKLSSVFRAIRTIKGTSGFLAFNQLEHVTHVGESLLVLLRDGKLRLNGVIATGLLAMVDAVRKIMANIEAGHGEGDADYAAPLAEHMSDRKHPINSKYTKGITMLAVLEALHSELAPPPAIVARLAKRADQLRMLPAVAIEALEIAKAPNCSIAEFAAVVERDVKLATDMLKIANSALYNPTTPIVNLHRAVLRLGFRECQYLIMTASIASLMNRMSLEQEWIRGVLWRHSFNTALLGIHLNRTFHLGFQGEEFTAGLIHDFGRTLLAVVAPEKFQELDPMEFDESIETLAHEQSILGTDHCRMGAWYAMQQELPSPLPEVILRHHQPDTAREGKRLTHLIAVADHMANHLQRFEESAGYDAAANPFWPGLAKFADTHFERHFVELAPALMEEAQADAEKLMQL